MVIGIGRRQFISALGGAAVAWPLGAHAQQPERIRRVGAVIAFAETNSDGQAAAAAFRHGLERLGRVEGQEYSSRLPLCRGRSDTLQNLPGRVGQPVAGRHSRRRHAGRGGAEAVDTHNTDYLAREATTVSGLRLCRIAQLKRSADLSICPRIGKMGTF